MSDENDSSQIEINVNTKCRCCLSNEGWRCMWERYEYNNLKEVYGEMIMECFALSWDIQSYEMICKSCVERLREAVKLKIEFMAVQELLQENFLVVDCKPVIDFPGEFELENGKREEAADPEASDMYVSEHDTESMDYSISDPETMFDQPLGQRKKKRPRDRRMYKKYSVDDMRNAKEAVRKGKMTIVKASEMYGIPKKTLANKLTTNTEEKDEERDAVQEKNLKLYEEIRTIIQYTNALPFKTKTAKYYCAYCSTDGPFFEDPNKLRKHITSLHYHELKRLVQQIMRPPWLNEILKMDITNLKCTVCNIVINDWNKMFMHFADTHDLHFDEAYTRVIPYSLTDNLKCVLCLESYMNFGQLDAHMNAHYCNYICYECGDTFLANSRLEKHLKIHKVGRYPCDKCGKVFTLDLYRSKHINLVHKQLAQVKCLYCPEKFLGTLMRHQHMLERHPTKVKVIACEACGKKFTWKKYYLDHLKKAHSNRYTCSKCNMSFPKKDELRNHLAEKVRMNDAEHT